MGYLDDVFLIGQTFNELKKAILLASVELFSNLGCFIHPYN